MHSILERAACDGFSTIYTPWIPTESGYELDDQYRIVGDPDYELGDRTVTLLSAQGPMTRDNRFPLVSHVPHSSLPVHQETLKRIADLIG